MSRGARKVTLVEKSGRALKIIRENINLLGLDDSVEVIGRDYRRALDLLDRRGEIYRLIIADPPYRMISSSGGIEKILSLLGGSDSLNSRTLVVLEHFIKADSPLNPPGWERIEFKEYGQTGLSFFQKHI